MLHNEAKAQLQIACITTSFEYGTFYEYTIGRIHFYTTSPTREREREILHTPHSRQLIQPAEVIAVPQHEPVELSMVSCDPHT